MKYDDHLLEHLELCKSVYEHLKKEGNWPWADSQNSGNLVESEDNSEEP